MSVAELKQAIVKGDVNTVMRIVPLPEENPRRSVTGQLSKLFTSDVKQAARNRVAPNQSDDKIYNHLREVASRINIDFPSNYDPYAPANPKSGFTSTGGRKTRKGKSKKSRKTRGRRRA